MSGSLCKWTKGTWGAETGLRKTSPRRVETESLRTSSHHKSSAGVPGGACAAARLFGGQGPPCNRAYGPRHAVQAGRECAGRDPALLRGDRGQPALCGEPLVQRTTLPGVAIHIIPVVHPLYPCYQCGLEFHWRALYVLGSVSIGRACGRKLLVTVYGMSLFAEVAGTVALWSKDMDLLLAIHRSYDSLLVG